MGGTRSLYQSIINILIYSNSRISVFILCSKNLERVMNSQIGQVDRYGNYFCDFDDLKILTGDNLMVSLSPSGKDFPLEPRLIKVLL